MVNDDIHFKEVLVIGPDGEQLGTMLRREALEKAYSMELDLMCVAPNAPVPVCKILDYGRYHFEDQKKQREAKKNQHVTEVKALRLSPVIDQHDFETKLKRSREWIEDGQKVRIDMRFRGRMITRQREAKKNQHVTEVKALRLSPVIDQHDFETKLKRSREWIEAGQKVRIDMRFRGRMITRQEVGRDVLNKFTEQISDIADVSKSAAMEGNTLSVVYSPKKGK